MCPSHGLEMATGRDARRPTEKPGHERMKFIQPDQALKEKCGEEMKSDNTWDLGTEGGQQRLLVPTAGVTAAYAEQAHKVTLNASSDIFARCSNLRT